MQALDMSRLIGGFQYLQPVYCLSLLPGLTQNQNKNYLLCIYILLNIPVYFIRCLLFQVALTFTPYDYTVQTENYFAAPIALPDGRFTILNLSFVL